MKGQLFIISGPSGSGKTTLVLAALQRLKEYAVEQCVTYTTREPREGEIHAKDYYFLTEDDFKVKIEQNFFLEWSTWYNHYYGTPRFVLQRLKEGISFLIILDRHGAASVKQYYSQAHMIWIEPASLLLLKKRLIARGKNSLQEIEQRIHKAQIEMEQEEKEKLYEKVIKNDDFELSCNEFITFLKKYLR